VAAGSDRRGAAAVAVCVPEPALFRYDALSEHASREEMQRIFAEARGKLFLLGLIAGVLYFIPPFNLIGSGVRGAGVRPLVFG